MTKKLMTLLLALLTMTACHDSKDEPSPNPAIQSIVLLCTDNIIYNLEGDTVFQTDADSHIQSLDSEGSDWYALISKVGGIYDIIRNGKSVFTTSQEIKAMGVYDRVLYTLQRCKNQDETYQWSVWKDSKPMYQLEYDQWYSYHDFKVNVQPTYPNYRPSLVMTAMTADSSYLWIDGGQFSLFGQGYSYIISMDIDYHGYGAIFCYEDWETRKYMYWFKYESHELDFYPTQVLVFDGEPYGTPYILGSKVTGQTGSRLTRTPVVSINGTETLLVADFLPKTLDTPVKMLQHGDDVFILTTGNGYSCVFKNQHPIECDALIYMDLLQDNILLLNQTFKDFAVVDSPF